MTDQMDALHTILTDVDLILRERLKVLGADVAHILLVIGPEGAIIGRGNVDPVGLKELGTELIEIAEEAMKRPENDDPIH